jgi:hypothetical protein
MKAPVLTPKAHKSVFDRKNTPLRDGRKPDIAPGITQKVLLSMEGLHMHDPLALLFVTGGNMSRLRPGGPSRSSRTPV